MQRTASTWTRCVGVLGLAGGWGEVVLAWWLVAVCSCVDPQHTHPVGATGPLLQAADFITWLRKSEDDEIEEGSEED